MAPPKRPWFRYYVEILHDRKLRTRPPAQRVLWDALMCMAASSPERGVLLVAEGYPADEVVIADEAALPIKDVREGLEYFASIGMVFRNEDDAWVVTQFLKRQFESDTSTDRTAKHRSIEDERNDVTPFEERSASVSLSSVSLKEETANGIALAFERFWDVYPLRVGKNAAQAAFAKAYRAVGADVLVVGAGRYRDDPNRERAFTKHPATWLRAGSWDDEPLPMRPELRQAPAVAPVMRELCPHPRCIAQGQKGGCITIPDCPNRKTRVMYDGQGNEVGVFDA